MPKAKQLALNAGVTDETVAEAHLALASVIEHYDWNWSSAEREYQRAIELSPGLVDTHSLFSLFLAEMGRSEEAFAEIKLAIRADPLDLLASYLQAQNFRRFDLARDLSQKTLELGPFLYAYYALAIAHTFLGNPEEARQACDGGLTVSANDPLIQSIYGWTHGMAGRRQEAESILDQLLQRRGEGYLSAWAIAQCCAGLGDADRALHWLDTAYEERDGLMPFLAHWPSFDPLRADPRFQALLRRMNFPETAASS